MLWERSISSDLAASNSLPASCHLSLCWVLPGRIAILMKSRVQRIWKRGWVVSVAFVTIFMLGACDSGDIASAQAPDSSATAKPQAPQPTHGQSLAGTWSGSLKAGDNVLHFVLHIGVTEYGVAVATIDSLDQGVYGIEAGSLKESGSSFQFDIPSVNATFVGTVAANRESIDGSDLDCGRHMAGSD